MNSEWVVAIGTLMLAFAAFSQVEESRRQIENSEKQLDLLRKQTEFMRSQIEVQEAAMMPKVSVQFAPIWRDGAEVTLVNHSRDSVYWRVGCIVPLPENPPHPSLIETGDCIAHIEPSKRCGSYIRQDPLKIEPGDTWCFAAQGITELADKLFSESDASEWLLALVIEVAYPLSSTGEARCVYKLRLLRSESETSLSGYVITLLPERAVCTAI